MTITIISLVTAGLQSGGFGGLVQPGECGCIIGDLSPAGCLREDCIAGYRHTHSERPSEWVVSPKKDGVTDAGHFADEVADGVLVVAAFVDGHGVTIDVKSGASRRWFVARDGIKRWSDTGAPTEPACDRSACRDHSPGLCDNPDCEALQPETGE